MDAESVDGTRVVTHHSVRLVGVMAFDVEHITCGTFSSGVGSPTSACIDCGTHVSCDAGHSSYCHLSAFIGDVLHLSCDAVHSFMPLRFSSSVNALG